MKGVRIDALNHDGSVFNWLQVKEAGYEFAWIHATTGNTYLNTYLYDARDAFNNGLVVGIYHLYDVDVAHHSQLRHFENNGIGLVGEWCAMEPAVVVDGNYRHAFSTSVTTAVVTAEPLVITGLGENPVEVWEMTDALV